MHTLCVHDLYSSIRPHSNASTGLYAAHVPPMRAPDQYRQDFRATAGAGLHKRGSPISLTWSLTQKYSHRAVTDEMSVVRLQVDL